MSTTQLALPTIGITDVLGNMLPVTRYYGDGSYDCPHCGYAIRADEGLGPCRNPWCIANPLVSPESARKILADRATKATDEARRKQDHESAMQRIADWQAKEKEERTAALLAAREKGLCITCLVRSHYRKEVRHRKACPYAR